MKWSVSQAADPPLAPHPAPTYSRTTLDEPALGFALDAPLIEGHSADVRRQGALHFTRGVGNEGRGGGQRDLTLCKSLRRFNILWVEWLSAQRRFAAGYTFPRTGRRKPENSDEYAALAPAP